MNQALRTHPIRFPLAARILALLLGIAALAILASAVLSFVTMRQISATALDGNQHLGSFAERNSSETLSSLAKDDLQRRARSQAEEVNDVFNRIQTQAEGLAQIAGAVMADPLYDTPRPGDTDAAPPADLRQRSSVVLAPGVSAPAVRSELNRIGAMDTFLAAGCAADPVLLGVHIGTPSGLMRNYPWMQGWPAGYDHRTQDWYVDAATSGKAAWTGPYISRLSHAMIVACSMPIHDRSGTLLGVIKLDLSMTTINQAVGRARVGNAGYTFLLDRKGEIIAMSDLGAANRPSGLPAPHPPASQDTDDQALSIHPVQLYDTDPNLEPVIRRMIAQEDDLTTCNLGKVDSFVAFAPVAANGWSVGEVRPIDEILAPARDSAQQLQAATVASSALIHVEVLRARMQMTLLFGLTLLASAWAALFLSRRITRPIRELTVGACQLGEGKLDNQLNIRTGDEIEQLAGEFNAMAGNLRTYIARIQEATTARLQAESELQVARKIQSSLLPRIFPPFPERSEIELFASMDPAREVGGDFFDFFFVDENRLCLAIGDVSDKGVPASLFMAVTKTLIRNEAQQPGRGAAEVLSRVNDRLCAENEMLMFVTVFITILDLRSGAMEFANAGHNPPVIGRSGGQIAYMKPGKGVALGVMEGAPFKTGRETLGRGDVLFIYTDGVNEAMNLKREQFSYERLLATLTTEIGRTAEEITDGMRAAISAFAGEAPQSDDITMITLRYHGPKDPP